MNEMNKQPSGTAMRAQTAAKKLGIYLPATPEEFQNSAVSHTELRELQDNPPQWLVDLRLNGPHPRPVVAQKLGISVTSLKKNEFDRPMTTPEIKELLVEMPEWLAAARKAHAENRDGNGQPASEDSPANES
ncbi:hypothetical protein WM42_0445 [Corynebacterium simulans]|nr:hypothetical protein WM42_0445 [Corynebacterium simulans]OFT48970.1 hypothetical protein HMPREF3158_00425 [Corynebacterium sp. HMSC06G04]